MFGVIVAHFVGDHLPVGPNRAQQRTGQRAGPGSGLQHPRTREDVALVDDLSGVLGIDNLRARAAST